ncbi:MAG: TerB family tellurite resistance protein [Deltaproteobacteria bacterium]|nr:TerB family tellurite resistance protein [Deltaproteobacteria bacterium]
MSSPSPQLLDALAFLYLTFGQVTDGELTQEEMRTLADKLTKRAPGIELPQLGQLLRRTVDAYKSIEGREPRVAQAQQCAAFLRDNIDDTMRQAVLADLMAIAAADGEVSADEQEFMARTAQTLGVPLPGA